MRVIGKVSNSLESELLMNRNDNFLTDPSDISILMDKGLLNLAKHCVKWIVSAGVI